MALPNKLYSALMGEHGEDNVETEVSTGANTFIDVVVKVSKERYWFYEIKTAETVKRCIRQAIPKSLEYAYWGGGERLERLIVESAGNEGREALPHPSEIAFQVAY